MANNITQLKIGSTTYDINDSRIITLTDNSTATAGTWLAKTSQISAYADGQIFLYKITKAGGSSTTTLNITGSANTALGAKTIYRSGTSKLTTHYGVGQYILLAYNSTNDCFRVVNDYDSNTTYTFNGAVSTIKDSNLTASRALVSNSSGKVAVSAVTSTELGYLDGVTSNIQTQLDGKAASSHGTHVSYGGNGSATTVSRSDHTHADYITGLEVEEMISSYDSSISNVYAPYSHTHNYAGSSSAGGAANSVKTNLTFNNGGSGAASGTKFNGSAARTISYNTIGAAPATHGHFVSFNSYSEIGALKYDITAGNVTTTSCWIAGYVSNIYSFGHVAKTGTNSYILFLWMGDVLYRSTYNGSSWTDNTRTYTQSNRLPSFSLSGTVLTITDNN